MTLSWWWCLPLAFGALCAAASPLATRRLRAETAQVEAATRVITLAASRVSKTRAPGGPGLDGR